MESVLTALAVYLGARIGMNLVVDVRGWEAFKNPGGWRLPLGEVVTFGSALLTFFLVGVTYEWMN